MKSIGNVNELNGFKIGVIILRKYYDKLKDKLPDPDEVDERGVVFIVYQVLYITYLIY